MPEFEQVQDLLIEVVALPRAEREAFLQDAAGEDAPLVREVRSLLGHHDAAESAHWLESTPLRVVVDEPVAEGPGGPKTPPTPGPEGLVQVGPYTLLEEIGRGGQGVVYRAHDAKLQRDVAIKVLSSWAAASEREVMRLEREARVLARLDHPSICGIFDFGRSAGTPYLVMRLVSGETLAARLAIRRETAGPGTSKGAAGAPADLPAAVHLIEQVARALEAAHAAGVTHRDIKPGNVMVTPEGAPVLLDFGLARGDERSLDDITRSGDIFGTPAYLAPELLEDGAQPGDARADVWSLGVTLYECLTGERPFQAPTRDGLYRAILRREPRPLRKLEPAIPVDLVAVVEAALQKDPARRYQSALALADDLAAWRCGRSVSVRPLGAWGRGLRWARRRPALAALVVSLALLVPALAGLAGYVMAKLPVIEAGEREQDRALFEELLDRGYRQLSEQREDAARATLGAALEMRPDAAEALAGIVICHILRKEGAPALALLDRAPALEAAHPELTWLRSEALRILERDDEAAAASARLGDWVPEGASAFLVRGILAMRRGARAEAVQDYRRAVLHADGPRLLYFVRLADAAWKSGDAATGREAAAILVRRWPDSASACFYAAVAIASTDHARAAELFGRCLEIDPAYHEVRPQRAAVLMNLNRHAEALDDLEKALRLAPRNPTLLSSRAAARQGVGDDDGALEDCEAALAIHPGHFDARLRRGLLHFAAQRWDEALADFRTLEERHPGHLRVLTRLADTLQESGQLEAALDPYARALEIAPENFRARRNYSALLERLGRIEEALAEIDRLLETHADSAGAHHHRARLLLRLHRFAASIAASDRAVALDPKLADAWHDRGCALGANGDMEEAVESFSAALALDPDRASTLRYRALALLRLQRTEDAIEDYAELTRLAPDDLAAHLLLAQARIDARQWKPAADALRRVLELDPGHAEARGLLDATLKRIDE